MGADLWSPIATSCNPPPGTGRNSSSLVMRVWEKHLIQPAFNAFFGARIGAIERKWPGFPARPDHGAPFVYYRVLFGHEHAIFSIQTTASMSSGRTSERSRK